MSQSLEPQMFTIKEASNFLNMSENTIRMWIWQKMIPSIKLGRSVRLKRSDLEQIIQSNRRDPVETVAL
jgi:excisionase family DNA binding protein